MHEIVILRFKKYPLKYIILEKLSEPVVPLRKQWFQGWYSHNQTNPDSKSGYDKQFTFHQSRQYTPVATKSYPITYADIGTMIS